MFLIVYQKYLTSLLEKLKNKLNNTNNDAKNNNKIIDYCCKRSEAFSQFTTFQKDLI